MPQSDSLSPHVPDRSVFVLAGVDHDGGVHALVVVFRADRDYTFVDLHVAGKNGGGNTVVVFV